MKLSLKKYFNWKLFSGSIHELLHPPASQIPFLDGLRSIAVLLLAALISFVPDRFWQRWGWDDALPAGRAAGVLRTGIAATCLVFATAALASQSYNPFIYFRF